MTFLPRFGLDVYASSTSGLFTGGWVLVASLCDLKNCECLGSGLCKLPEVYWVLVLPNEVGELEVDPLWPYQPDRCPELGGSIRGSVLIEDSSTVELSVEEVMCCDVALGTMWSYMASTSLGNCMEDSLVCTSLNGRKSIFMDAKATIGVKSGKLTYAMKASTVESLCYALHIVGINVVIDRIDPFVVLNPDSGKPEEHTVVLMQLAREPPWETESVGVDGDALAQDSIAVATATVTMSIALTPAASNGGYLVFTKRPIFTIHRFQDVLPVSGV